MHTHKLFRPALAVSALALAASLSTPALAEAGDAAVAAADDSGTSTATTPATTTDDNTKIEWHGQIVVYGRGEKRIGEAAAASEGGVAGADIDIRPLLRPGELLEATPGLIATQHSGGGKANQYFLRGFNLDHGTDFALYVDDMPMNFRTHGHGQGYLDVNGLIPEVVARVDYRKGPYRASTGDFSFVGSSYITQFNKFGRTFQVYAQAAPEFRIRPEDIRNLSVKAGDGTMVPLGTVVDVKSVQGPSLISLYNLYPTATIVGGSAAGFSSGQALDVMEQIADRTLPPGAGFEWTALSYQEKAVGTQIYFVFGLAMLLVYQTPSLRWVRLPALTYALVMCFAAVYLQHHYVIDVLLGLLYAVITAIVVLAWERRR